LFFDREMVSLRILNVVELKQEQVSRNVSARPFDALSFRLSSDVRMEGGGQTRQMQDDTISFIPAGLQYSRNGTRDELIAVHFQMTDAAETQMEILRPQDPAAMRDLFRRILACWKGREQGYQYQCTALLYEILARCRRQLAQGRAEGRIQPSLDYLAQNWNQPDLTVGELAKQSFMSEVYFRRLFKEGFGLSPQKYLVQLRVQKAAELIHTGYYTLKEVAVMCGYRDYKYFSVEFRRLMGCTPSAYKKGFA